MKIKQFLNNIIGENILFSIVLFIYIIVYVYYTPFSLINAALFISNSFLILYLYMKNNEQRYILETLRGKNDK